VILLMVVAVGELFATMRTRGHRPLALFGLVGVALMGIGSHVLGVGAIGGWFSVIVTMTLLFVSLTRRRNPLQDVSLTVMGMAWVGMLAFAIRFGVGARPVENILFCVLVVATNDMGGYFVGRSFGKTRLAPVVSPSKTVEGLFGGLILGAITASVLVTFPAWEPIGLAKGLVLAAVVGVFCPLGDLAESMVKRSIGVKDMGSVLPGHGGMLDRIDGFLFAVPALYFGFIGFGLL
jgi:phosphatidate cytidylyltransferase